MSEHVMAEEEPGTVHMTVAIALVRQAVEAAWPPLPAQPPRAADVLGPLQARPGELLKVIDCLAQFGGALFAAHSQLAGRDELLAAIDRLELGLIAGEWLWRAI